MTFARTPIMSTYLLAFIVGEYDFVEATDSNGVKIRVYTPVGKAEEGRFALDVSCGCGLHDVLHPFFVSLYCNSEWLLVILFSSFLPPFLPPPSLSSSVLPPSLPPSPCLSLFFTLCLVAMMLVPPPPSLYPSFPLFLPVSFSTPCFSLLSSSPTP